jgi:hypothetical protein
MEQSNRYVKPIGPKDKMKPCPVCGKELYAASDAMGTRGHLASHIRAKEMTEQEKKNFLGYGEGGRRSYGK